MLRKIFVVATACTFVALSLSSCSSKPVSLCEKYSTLFKQLNDTSYGISPDPAALDRVLNKEFGVSDSNNHVAKDFSHYFSGCLSGDAADALIFTECTSNKLGVPLMYSASTWPVYHDALLRAGCISY